MMKKGKTPMQLEGQGNDAPLRLDFSSLAPRIRVLDAKKIHILKSKKKLGAGKNGKVYEGRYGASRVAVKVLELHDMGVQEMEVHFQREALLASTAHPNIVQFIGMAQRSDSLMLVMEFLGGGSVKKLLFGEDDIPPDNDISACQIVLMLLDVAQGMEHLHEANIVHRDLASKNLVLTKYGRVKICDFGHSAMLSDDGEEQLAQGIGTALYMAPEVMEGGEIGVMSDVYSFGILMWELMFRTIPWGRHNSNLTKEVFFNYVCEGNRPSLRNYPIVDDKLSILFALMESCWQADPTKRPTFSDICVMLRRKLIDIAIDSEEGRDFWWENASIMNYTEMSFEMFFETFYAYCAKIPDMDWDAINGNLSLMTDSQLNCLSEHNEAWGVPISNEMRQRYGTGERPTWGWGKVSPKDDELCTFDAELCRLLIVGKGAPPEEQIVSVEKFGIFLANYGPICDPISGSVILFDNIRRLCAAPWFHGPIDQDASQTLLTPFHEGHHGLNRNDYAYLIRQSSKPGCFTISRTARGNEIVSFVHDRIVHVQQCNSNDLMPGYHFNGQAYTSLDYIAHVVCRHGIVCPGSQFVGVFQPRKVKVLYEKREATQKIPRRFLISASGSGSGSGNVSDSDSDSVSEHSSERHSLMDKKFENLLMYDKAVVKLARDVVLSLMDTYDEPRIEVVKTPKGAAIGLFFLPEDQVSCVIDAESLYIHRGDTNIVVHASSVPEDTIADAYEAEISDQLDRARVEDLQRDVTSELCGKSGSDFRSLSLFSPDDTDSDFLDSSSVVHSSSSCGDEDEDDEDDDDVEFHESSSKFVNDDDDDDEEDLEFFEVRP